MQGLWVEPVFIEKLESIKIKRRFVVIHGPIIKQREGNCKENENEFNQDDPMTVLMECMRLQNLRLVDLFTSLDKDGSGTLSRQEFKEGLLVSININY